MMLWGTAEFPASNSFLASGLSLRGKKFLLQPKWVFGKDMVWFLTFGRYSATGIPKIDCGLQVIGVGRVFPGMGLRFFVPPV